MLKNVTLVSGRTVSLTHQQTYVAEAKLQARTSQYGSMTLNEDTTVHVTHLFPSNDA